VSREADYYTMINNNNKDRQQHKLNSHMAQSSTDGSEQQYYRMIKSKKR
jgi:hypothetical protein